MKLSELPTNASLSTDDLIYCVDDAAGTPQSRRTTIAAVLGLSYAGTNTWTGLQTFTAATALAKGVVVRGAVGQAANLQEWQDSAGTALLSVTKDGYVQSSDHLRLIHNTGSQIEVARSDAAAFPVVSITGQAGTGGISIGYSGFVGINTNGGPSIAFADHAIALLGNQLFFSSTGNLAWSSGATIGVSDVGLGRLSAGVITVTNGSSGSGSLQLVAASSSTIPMTIKSAAGQTSNIQEWQNSSGAVIASVGPTGVFKFNSHYGDIVTGTDGGTITFDMKASDKHQVTLGGSRTLAVTNDQVGHTFMLLLKQDATGGRTVMWWSGILWASGIAPTLTATANKFDVLSFVKIDTGTYLGFVVGQGF